MKKQMERTGYEAPVTERFSVELEGTFCASIYEDQTHHEGVTTAAQDYQEISANQGFLGTGTGEDFKITWE